MRGPRTSQPCRGSGCRAALCAPPGFTLPELLITIALIAALAALALPGLARARGRVVAIRCLAQLRQVHVLLADYAEAHGGQLPGAPEQVAGVPPGLEFVLPVNPLPALLGEDRAALELFACPAQRLDREFGAALPPHLARFEPALRAQSYAYAGSYGPAPIRLDALRDPAATPLLWDRFEYRHAPHFNALFADGHADHLPRPGD